jgi:hypothetical protein
VAILVVCGGDAGPAMQQMRFAHISWRDVQLDLPSDWELFRAVRKNDQWRCSFADRYHQRVDIRWRKLGYVPDLERMLERHQEKEQKERTVTLTGQPEEWKGTLRQTQGGWVVNAGRFLEQTGILVEMILVWPERRDAELESRILASVRPIEEENGMKLWEAMGMKARVGAKYDILEYKAEAGKVEWTFGQQKTKGPKVMLQRMAMPKYWLRGTVAEWLLTEAAGRSIQEEWTANVNGHVAAGMRSSARVLLVDSVLLKRQIRAEVAWLCQKELRVYRMACTAAQRSKELGIPTDVKIECCQG